MVRQVLKIIFTLFEREGMKEMFYLQVYNSQGWARLMAGTGNSVLGLPLAPSSTAFSSTLEGAKSEAEQLGLELACT